MSIAGVNSEIMSQFYDACAEFGKLQPWKYLVDRQAIQIDAHEEVRLDAKNYVGGGSIYVSVLGNSAGDEGLRGLALFFSRTDLQRRVLMDGQKLAMLENPKLRRCALCDKKASGDKELRRCTRCKCTFYCDAVCQVKVYTLYINNDFHYANV